MLTPKYAKVEEINKRLRILPSKDGEMTPFEPSNMLIISDYASNINRIASIINQLDTPEAGSWKSQSPTKPGSLDEQPKTKKGTPQRPPTAPTPGKSASRTGGGTADELDRLFED